MNKDNSDKIHICKKCKIEMNYIGSKQNGPYYVCKECNDIKIVG